MNALIFKRHAAPFPRFQVTDDSKHSGSATTQPAYSYRRIQQRSRCFPRSAEPTENSPRQKPPRSPGPMAKSTPISCETAQNPQGRDRNALDCPFARTRHKHVPGNGARNERRERPSNNEHNHHGNTHRRRNQPKPRHGRQPPRKRSSRTCRPIFRKRNSPHRHNHNLRAHRDSRAERRHAHCRLERCGRRRTHHVLLERHRSSTTFSFGSKS